MLTGPKVNDTLSPETSAQSYAAKAIALCRSGAVGDGIALYRKVLKRYHSGTLPRRYDKWIALSQYGFPFSIGPYPTPVARFRALARRTRFARKGQLLRSLANIAMTLGWPIRRFLDCTRDMRTHGGRGQEPTRDACFLRHDWLALRHSIPPLEYALYCFNEPARRKDMHEYVYWNDLPGLAALNARLGADNRDVQDKDRFAEICATQWISACADSRRVRGRQAGLSRDALCARCSRKSGSRPCVSKAAPAAPNGSGTARPIATASGRRVPAANLADEFRKQDCLVQPFIENHPDIAQVTNGALASLRIVTGLNERQRRSSSHRCIALPHGAHETSVAGILCSIDA